MRTKNVRSSARGMLTPLLAIGVLIFAIALVVLIAAALVVGAGASLGFLVFPFVWILGWADIFLLVGIVAILLGWFL